MVKRKGEMALADAEQNKAIREKYLKTDKVSFVVGTYLYKIFTKINYFIVCIKVYFQN